ncbi:hypothetical protein CHS0354_027952 [Potamilus streckersoni]|uniref:Uncharacterized protein n=1 Tax=Potamilus streckersoni TaxID=2493646 RepID=A0AAE0T5F3_9BIVA|nr:hypothetical protein CHS0354_027952 [Potamilus streckersoni]
MYWIGIQCALALPTLRKALWFPFPIAVFMFHLANVPYTATMMSMYEWLQSIQNDFRRPPSTVDNFFQGCIASAVALFVTFPLDTIKRRLQQPIQMLSNTFIRPNYQPSCPFWARSAVQPYFGPGMCWFIGGTWACIKAAWKDNGIHSFFKGYFPAFIRVVPYHGVMFLTYEACKQFCLIYNGYSRPLLSGRSHEAIDQHLDQEELEDVDYFAFEKELGGIDLDDFEDDILEVEEESEEDGQEEAEEEHWKETIGQDGF